METPQEVQVDIGHLMAFNPHHHFTSPPSSRLASSPSGKSIMQTTFTPPVVATRTKFVVFGTLGFLLVVGSTLSFPLIDIFEPDFGFEEL